MFFLLAFWKGRKKHFLTNRQGRNRHPAPTAGAGITGTGGPVKCSRREAAEDAETGPPRWTRKRTPRTRVGRLFGRMPRPQPPRCCWHHGESVEGKN